MRVLKVPILIGRLKAYLVSNVIDNEVGYTKIVIAERTICTVSGQDRYKIIEELNEVIDKYKI